MPVLILTILGILVLISGPMVLAYGANDRLAAGRWAYCFVGSAILGTALIVLLATGVLK
jgi:hypothetical protein